MQMYFLALVLPPALNAKILTYKQMMLEKYDCKVGLKSPAHITLIAPFWMEEQHEQQLVSDIENLSRQFSPFQLSTNNFSAFKPRTIFIDVSDSEALNNLKGSADHFFKNREPYRIKIDTRAFHPHITIATRDLSKKTFYEIWPWFAEKTFKEEWIAGGISLLKHNKKNWDVIFTSQFHIVHPAAD